MVEALSVSLTGADGDGLAPHEGALVICLAGSAFRPAAEVAESLDALRARLRDSSGATTPVLAPGDPEMRSRAVAGGVVTADSALVGRLIELARHTPGEEASP
jgi:hypothetical protein